MKTRVSLKYFVNDCSFSEYLQIKGSCFAQLVVWLYPDVYWKPSLTNKMHLLSKIVHGLRPFFQKGSILDIWLGSEHASRICKIALLFPVGIQFLISNKKDTWSRYFKSSFFWRSSFFWKLQFSVDSTPSFGTKYSRVDQLKFVEDSL